MLSFSSTKHPSVQLTTVSFTHISPLWGTAGRLVSTETVSLSAESWGLCISQLDREARSDLRLITVSFCSSFMVHAVTGQQNTDKEADLALSGMTAQESGHIFSATSSTAANYSLRKVAESRYSVLFFFCHVFLTFIYLFEVGHVCMHMCAEI